MSECTSAIRRHKVYSYISCWQLYCTCALFGGTFCLAYVEIHYCKRRLSLRNKEQKPVTTVFRFAVGQNMTANGFSLFHILTFLVAQQFFLAAQQIFALCFVDPIFFWNDGFTRRAQFAKMFAPGHRMFFNEASMERQFHFILGW